MLSDKCQKMTWPARDTAETVAWNLVVTRGIYLKMHFKSLIKGVVATEGKNKVCHRNMASKIRIQLAFFFLSYFAKCL